MKVTSKMKEELVKNEQRRLNKKYDYPVRTLENGSTQDGYLLFTKSLYELVNRNKAYSTIRQSLKRLKDISFRTVLTDEAYKAELLKDSSNARKKFVNVKKLMHDNRSTARDETEDEKRERVFLENFEKKKTSEDMGEEKKKQSPAATGTDPEAQGSLHTPIPHGTPKTGTPEEQGTPATPGTKELDSEDEENGEVKQSRGEVKQREPESPGERMKRQVQRKLQLISNSDRDRRAMLESAIVARTPILEAVASLTAKTNQDAEEQMVYDYIIQKRQVQTTLEPVFRDLVSNNLLVTRFGEVAEKLNRTDGEFDVILFSRLASEHYNKSTLLIELKHFENIETATVAATGSVQDIVNAMLVPVRKALASASAGDGSEAEAKSFYRKYGKFRVLSRLCNMHKFDLFFATIDSMEILATLRSENFNDRSWNIFLERMKLYEAATNSGKDESNGSTISYAADTNTTSTKTEITDMQIKDITKSVSKWTDADFEKPICYSCGGNPCKYPTPGGKCKCHKTAKGKSNRTAAFEERYKRKPPTTKKKTVGNIAVTLTNTEWPELEDSIESDDSTPDSNATQTTAANMARTIIPDSFFDDESVHMTHHTSFWQAESQIDRFLSRKANNQGEMKTSNDRFDNDSMQMTHQFWQADSLEQDMSRNANSHGHETKTNNDQFDQSKNETRLKNEIPDYFFENSDNRNCYHTKMASHVTTQDTPTHQTTDGDSEANVQHQQTENTEGETKTSIDVSTYTDSDEGETKTSTPKPKSKEPAKDTAIDRAPDTSAGGFTTEPATETAKDCTPMSTEGFTTDPPLRNQPAQGYATDTQDIRKDPDKMCTQDKCTTDLKCTEGFTTAPPLRSQPAQGYATDTQDIRKDPDTMCTQDKCTTDLKFTTAKTKENSEETDQVNYTHNTGTADLDTAKERRTQDTGTEDLDTAKEKAKEQQEEKADQEAERHYSIVTKPKHGSAFSTRRSGKHNSEGQMIKPQIKKKTKEPNSSPRPAAQRTFTKKRKPTRRYRKKKKNHKDRMAEKKKRKIRNSIKNMSLSSPKITQIGIGDELLDCQITKINAKHNVPNSHQYQQLIELRFQDGTKRRYTAKSYKIMLERGQQIRSKQERRTANKARKSKHITFPNRNVVKTAQQITPADAESEHDTDTDDDTEDEAEDETNEEHNHNDDHKKDDDTDDDANGSQGDQNRTQRQDTDTDENTDSDTSTYTDSDSNTSTDSKSNDCSSCSHESGLTSKIILVHTVHVNGIRTEYARETLGSRKCPIVTNINRYTTTTQTSEEGDLTQQTNEEGDLTLCHGGTPGCECRIVWDPLDTVRILQDPVHESTTCTTPGCECRDVRNSLNIARILEDPVHGTTTAYVTSTNNKTPRTQTIVDTGAVDTLVTTPDGLTNMKSCHVSVSGVGGETSSNCVGDLGMLRGNVYVVPSLDVNLLSTGRLLENTNTKSITISKPDPKHPEHQIIKLKLMTDAATGTGTIIAERSKATKLQYLVTDEGMECMGLARIKTSAHTVTEIRDRTEAVFVITATARLGNPSESTMSHMALHGTVDGFYTNTKLLRKHLGETFGIGTNEAAIVGSLKTKSYKKSTTEDRLDKKHESFGSNIHTDTWIFEKDEKGLNNEIGMQVCVDSFTSTVWVDTVKSMRDIPKIIARRITQIEEEARKIQGDGFYIQNIHPADKEEIKMASEGRTVRRLRADRHPVHNSEQMRATLEQSLTVLKLTPAQGHATNGKVERAIQELKKIAKSFMKQVGFTSILKELLPYAAIAAAQALDLWPHTGNKNNMSRREARTGTKGNMDDLCPFTFATAYWRLDDDKRGARTGISVERILNADGKVQSHMILDVRTMKVHNARTAVFNERLSEYPPAGQRIDSMVKNEIVHPPILINSESKTETKCETKSNEQHKGYYDFKYNRFYQVDVHNDKGRFKCAYDEFRSNSQGGLRTHFNSENCKYDIKTRASYEPTHVSPIIKTKRKLMENQTIGTTLCDYCAKELPGQTPTGRESLVTQNHIKACKLKNHNKTLKQRANTAKKEQQNKRNQARIKKNKEKYGSRATSKRTRTKKLSAYVVQTVCEKPNGMQYTVSDTTISQTQPLQPSRSDISPQYIPRAVGISIMDIIEGNDLMEPEKLNEAHDLTLQIDRTDANILDPTLTEGYNTTTICHSGNTSPIDVSKQPIHRNKDKTVKFKDIQINGVTHGTSSSLTPAKSSEVQGHPLEEYWRAAEKEEYQQLLDTKTIVEATENSKHPTKTRPIKAMMVYKIKFGPDGITIVKFKCRMVALGFMQVAGIHYDTYACSAPVARGSTFMMIIAAAVKQGLLLKQADVKGAYLISKIDKSIHIRLPNDPRLYEVLTGLYGLKQSGHLWNNRFTEELVTIGFYQSKNDRCLYIYEKKNAEGEIEKCWIAIWVDDILAAVSTEELWDKLYSALHARCPSVQMKLQWLLGMKITETNNKEEGRRIHISQESKITGLLQQLGMSDCNSVRTPLPTTAALPNSSACPKTDEAERMTIAGLPHKNYPAFRTEYREILGLLSHIAEYGRPDLMQSVHYLARFQAYPSTEHYQLVKRIVRYCKGTKDLAMVFGNTNHPYYGPLVSFVDSDFAGDTESSKSTTGSVFLVYGTPIEVKSSKQKCVTKSSTEAELVAASQSVCTALYFKRIMEEDLKIQIGKVPMYEDNDACITIANNGSVHSRTRHIRVADAWIYQEVHDNQNIDIKNVDTKNNIADMFTKSLPKAAFEKHRNMLMTGEVEVKKSKVYVSNVNESWRNSLLNGKKYTLESQKVELSEEK